MGKLTRNLPRISPIPENTICCEYHLEKAEFFCCHCHTSVCDLCAQDQHFDHTFQSLEQIQGKAAKKPNQKTIMCDKSVEARIQDIEKALAEIDLDTINKKTK